jgi:uncharacterized damage-inducible protein DinB
MPDATIEATPDVLEQSLGEIRKGIADLSVDELNARPAGGNTNSIAVIATHALGATLSWLSLGLGGSPPSRDRDAEFRTVADEGFVAWVESNIARCLDLLDGATWDPTRMGTPTWNSRLAGQPRTAAYSIAHALAHLGEHVGHMHMTRELLRPNS